MKRVSLGFCPICASRYREGRFIALTDLEEPIEVHLCLRCAEEVEHGKEMCKREGRGAPYTHREVRRHITRHCEM